MFLSTAQLLAFKTGDEKFRPPYSSPCPYSRCREGGAAVPLVNDKVVHQLYLTVNRNPESDVLEEMFAEDHTVRHMVEDGDGGPINGDEVLVCPFEGCGKQFKWVSSNF